MTTGRQFAIAHVMPGRIRLRWCGDGRPSGDLLSRLRSAACVTDVDYRPTSRSVVILHSSGFELHDLYAETGDLNLGAIETPGPTPWARISVPDATDSGVRKSVVTDLEALLTFGLMIVWLREAIVGRAIRPATVILLVLAGLGLYQYWQRRQQKPGEAASTEQESASS